MPGIAVRRTRYRVEQALIMRRDVKPSGRQMMTFASRVAMMFLIDRLRVHSGASPVALSPAERAWITGAQEQVYFRVYSEAALFKVVERAREAGLVVHVGESRRRMAGRDAPVPVCCAVGPALTEQIDAIVGDLTLW
jgi:peptidyl-tRNA hydrolase